MIAFSSVAFFLGPILVGLGLVMLAPCFLAWEMGSADLGAFLISDAATMATAATLILATRHHKPVLRIREMFLLTNLAWFMVCLFGALPFVLSQTVGGLTDAVFESVSAVTTTGATVLSQLDQLPKDILLWRSTMQWIGGLGIIGLGAAILPYLRIGGMRLFRTESSDLSEKALPKTRRVLSRLLLTYLILTALCAGSYWVAGMDAFDAINHAMTTVSTGGFSTHDKSFAFFESGRIEIVGVLFMLLGGVPFMLYLPILSGHPTPLLRDSQVHTMLLIYFGAASLLAVWLVATGQMESVSAFREAAFNVVSIATTTGFVSADYMEWGALAVMLFFFLTFVGGCSGSTSGGIKIFRFKIAFVMFRETIL
ncbi:MAG: TrkH family potassium uptake protein, partial [Halioglobus sp.]|nr:TrkH family potassium uptake protein [Halioglobus sp.]